MAVSAQEILHGVGAEADPRGCSDTSRTLVGVASFDNAGPGQLSFCVGPGRRPQESDASMLIVSSSALEGLPPGSCRAVIAASDNARLDFIRAVRRFFAPGPPEPGVHPSAVIAPGARIGDGVTIGPLCTVSSDVEIGHGSILHAGVHVYSRVKIGARVTVHSGTVIGADGYGFERNEKGELERFPHVGGVVIDDDVEIGANASIDRGALDDTRIGTRAKIDNCVHVAHNVTIGEDAAVIAHAMLGGSSAIGDRAWIAPCTAVREGLSVGKEAMTGMGAVVTKSVPDGTTVAGNPAREIGLHQTLQRTLRSLADQDAEGHSTTQPEHP